MTNLNYGVIGNGQSAALISESGSIDWCCLPAFDSPSVFARILDTDRGGHFGIEMKGETKITQRYLSRTNILVTTFTSGEDAFEVYDFMPRHKHSGNGYICPPDLIRYIVRLSGNPQICIDYQPKLSYSQPETVTKVHSEYLKSVTAGQPYESLFLYSDCDLESIRSSDYFNLEEECFFWMSYNEKIVNPDLHHVRLEFERTKVYWMDWVSESRASGPWSDLIERSALVLKLLAYQKTGAVLAAVTTSLPEEIGSTRNWDYRFCWLRDASMIIKVFTQLGHYRVGSRFLQFVLDVIAYKDDKVQIMYGIDGQRELKEKELTSLAGYEGSAPVRVGNAAYKQKQNDIYGLVMDTIYQRLADHPESVENIEGIWTVVRSLVRHVEQNWKHRDAGIWEIRGGKRHFVFSKLLCWVAIDRAIKIADYLGKDQYIETWSTLRETIHADVLNKGWSDRLQAFTQSYGDDQLDAANLLMEHYGFIEATDPRYMNTVNLTYEKLCHKGLMYRYMNTDDFGKPTTSFTVCTFWMIKSLHRIGRSELAKEMFEELLGNANHLGLFSEDMDFSTKRLLGNFPQGYSHLALIDTALTLMNGEDHTEPIS